MVLVLLWLTCVLPPCTRISMRYVFCAFSGRRSWLYRGSTCFHSSPYQHHSNAQLPWRRWRHQIQRLISAYSLQRWMISSSITAGNLSLVIYYSSDGWRLNRPFHKLFMTVTTISGQIQWDQTARLVAPERLWKWGHTSCPSPFLAPQVQLVVLLSTFVMFVQLLTVSFRAQPFVKVGARAFFAPDGVGAGASVPQKCNGTAERWITLCTDAYVVA